MNRNMKKIVTTLVAFNVVASTVIAVLPTQGFAAENNTNTGEKKLLSTVSATQNLFKNTNFTSTSTNIPDWTVYANQNAEGDATIQTYGTKTTTDWFNYSRTSVRPKGDGSIELYGTANSQIGVTQIINTIPGKSYTVSYNYNTTSFSTIAYLIGTATSNYFSATDVSTGTLNNEKWTSSGGNAGSGRMNYTPWLVGGSGTVNQTFVATGSKTRVFIAAGLNSADKTNVVYQTISGVNITGASAEQLAAPKLNPVKDKDAKVTGSLTGSLDSLKEVQIYKNDVYVGTAKVTGSNYELAVSGSKVGDVYKAYAVDIWGVKSNAASQTVTATAIATPTINEITDKATTATGTGEPGSTLTLKIGDATYTTTVAADGTWSKAITKPKAGTAVEAVSVKDSVTSAKATTTVVDVTAPDAPVLSTVTDADTHVKGTGEAGTTVKVTLPNNATVEGEVDASGNFDVVIPKQAKDAIISAKLTDKAGNVSAAGTTTVVHQGPSAPVLNDVTDKSTTVSGTGEPGDTITVKITDNGASVSYSGKVDDFGEFSIPIDKPSAGAKVEAIAKDPSGALSPKASTTVKDVTAPDAPKVNPVKVDDTKVTGQGEPNCTVKVTLPSGGVVTGTTDDEGNFSVTIPKQTVDKEIKVTLTDASDNESKPTSVTVQADIIAKPTIKEVTTDDTKVSGTGVAGATVTIKANDIEYTGVVAADGTYAITIPKQDVGEAITAKQAKDGASSDTASTTVVRGAIAKTTINSLTTDSTSVSGTAEPNSTVVVKDQKGTQIATGRTGSDGIYSMTIAKQAEGTVVTATATADGKTSSANTTVVRDGIAATTIDTLTADATTATGTAEPNATIVIKNAAGTTIGSGTVGSDGKYSLTIPKQAEGTVVTATATLDGKTSAGSTTVKAGQDIAKTTINALTNDSTTVSGKGEPNATIVVKNGDTTIATGTVGSDGSYSLTIPKQATDSVVTATTTKDGKTSSASTTVTKQATGSVVVTAPYYVGYDSSVKATVSGDATKVYLQVGDTKYTTVPVSGSFTYYAKDKITATTQDAYIVALDASGKELSRAKVTLKDGKLLVGTVTPKEFIVSADSYVTGTYTGSVTKVAISVNGKVYPAVAVTGSGALQYYAKDKITDKTDVVKMIGYNSEGTIIDTKDVSVAGPESLVGAITINPSNFAISTDSYVKGTFTGNVKTVSLVVNGVESAKVGVIDGTTWQYYAKGKILKPTDVVSVKAYNAAGTLVDTKTLTVTQNPAGTSTIVPAAFKLKTDTNVKGTFTGSVKYVALKVGDTVYSKVAVVDGTNWQYYAKDKITDDKTAVSVIGYDSTGTQIATATVTITPESTSTLTASTYLLGTGNVTGTYTGTVKYVAVKINDTTYTKVPVNADGTYTYYIKDKVTSKDDVITVLGYDSTGAVVAEKAVTLDPGVAPTMKADDFTIGTTRNVTGTFTGGIKYVGIKVGDTTYTKVPVAADGTYTYYAKDKITDATEEVTVLGYDSVGLALEVKVTVK